MSRQRFRFFTNRFLARQDESLRLLTLGRSAGESDRGKMRRGHAEELFELCNSFLQRRMALFQGIVFLCQIVQSSHQTFECDHPPGVEL